MEIPIDMAIRTFFMFQQLKKWNELGKKKKKANIHKQLGI